MMERASNRKSGRSGKSMDTRQLKDHRQSNDTKDMTIATSSAAVETQGETSALGRPSVFQEGSMNDRVSAVPPSRFTGQEAAMERYAQEGQITVQSAAGLMKPLPAPPAAALGPPSSNPDHDTVTSPDHKTGKTDKEAQQRRSGIFRLGKSIVSVFNRDDVTHKKKQEPEESQPKGYMVDEHRQRVEKIYAEMKKDGRLPALTMSPRPHVPALQRTVRRKHADVGQATEINKAPRHASEEVPASKDTTAVEVSHPVVEPSKDAPSVTSPAAESTTTHHRTPFHIRKRSVPNLKKVKSNIHRLTSESLVALGTMPSVPKVSVEDPDGVEPDRKLRPQMSRKDLQKQQKLSKRVSNLEGKLQHARRELDEALGQRPVLGPLQSNTVSMRAFGPGTLPSLPSERLLLVGGCREEKYAPGKTDENGLSAGDAPAKTQESRMCLPKEISPGMKDAQSSVTQSSKQKPNVTPDKRKAIEDSDDDNYDTDAQGHASHRESTPSKRRRVDVLSPGPSAQDPPTNNNNNNNDTTSTPVMTTKALIDQVAMFENALEPRPTMTIQSIAEETMMMVDASSSSAAAMVGMREPTSTFGTPSRSTIPWSVMTGTLSPTKRGRGGSRIPRRSISPPPPSAVHATAAGGGVVGGGAGAATAMKLRMKGSMPALSGRGDELVKNVGIGSAWNRGGVFVAAAASAAAPLTAAPAAAAIAPTATAGTAGEHDIKSGAGNAKIGNNPAENINPAAATAVVVKQKIEFEWPDDVF